MKPSTRSYYRDAVLRAVETIGASLDAALDLHALARAAATSPFHFHRIFRGMLGETPLELHRRLRLERAARTLVTSECNVMRVALEAGYETHSSFTRAFRSNFGVSPVDFRSQARADGSGSDLDARCRIEATSGIHVTTDGIDVIPTTQMIQEYSVNVEIRDYPTVRLAYTPHVGPYQQIGEAFGRLGAVAGPAGLFGPDSAMIGVYHDDPETTAPEELRSEAGVTIGADATLPEGLEERDLPAGAYAVATYQGPYSGLAGAWHDFMGGWLPESGRRLAEGVCFEVYVSDPETTPENELVTELFVPIAG